MPERKRKGVPEHRSNVLKGSLPQGPSAHPRNTEYPKLSEESEKESRDEVTQRGMEGLYQKESRDESTQRGMEGLYQKESRDEATQRGMEELYQKESRDEVIQRGMEEPYQKQRGSR